jgi:hypothetical protein
MIGAPGLCDQSGDDWKDERHAGDECEPGAVRAPANAVEQVERVRRGNEGRQRRSGPSETENERPA